MTRLDHNRALAQLALTLQVPVSAIGNVTLWGNHSATQVPDIAHGMVTDSRGVPRALPDALAAVLGSPGTVEAWRDETFIPRVAKRGAETIEARGSSSAASAAAAAVDHMRDWVLGTGSSWTSVPGFPTDSTESTGG